MSKRVALICGFPAQGKSTSIRNMDNVLHINCEGSAKELTFSIKGKKAFKTVTIEHPDQLIEAFEYAEIHNEYETIIVDGLNFLMDMYETQNVYTSSDTRSAWQDYGQFLKDLMQSVVAKSSKNVIFLSHVDMIIDERTKTKVYAVPIKGALKKSGIEAFFSTILFATVKTLEDLEDISNDLLTFTDEEKKDGFKYVFQTRLTKNDVGLNVRSPIGLFDRSELYIDSDTKKVIERLQEYYD